MARSPKQPDAPDGPLDPLVEEAINFLLHLHSGKETEEDWAAYQNWKDGSAERRAAADYAESIWHGIGPAAARKKPKKTIPVIVIGVLGLTTFGFALGLFGEPRSYFADYQTAIGERKIVTLRDGSQVDIDSGTSFDIGADGRTIFLYAGQVFLSVESSPSRPFSVNAASGTVRTLGTKFGVRRDAGTVTTFVTENAVRVSYTGDPQKTVDVQAGQVTHYSPDGGLQPARSADIRELTAWQRGELRFKDQTLSKVVSELERYRRGRILLIGDDVRNLRVSGVFDIQDPVGALASLSLALPISVHNFPGLTVIYGVSERQSREQPEKK